MLRPRRLRKAPKRYWDEFVVTDNWYVEKMLEDVPASELQAACVDSDFEADESERSESEETNSSDNAFVEIDSTGACDDAVQLSNVSLSGDSTDGDASTDGDTSTDGDASTGESEDEDSEEE